MYLYYSAAVDGARDAPQNETGHYLADRRAASGCRKSTVYREINAWNLHGTLKRGAGGGQT
jgi:hypothetical protein